MSINQNCMDIIFRLKQEKEMLGKIWKSRRGRFSLFFLLISLLTVTVILMLPPVRNSVMERTHYRVENGPEIAGVPEEQYDNWGRGRGDCPENRMIIGNFHDTRKMGSFAFGFERLYVVKEINENYETDVVAEIKCTHLEGKDGFGKFIPNHKLQFIIVAEKDGKPLMNLYFSYRRDDSDGCFFYNVPRYDEEEYKYDYLHETFPWTANGVYVHFVPCGFDLYDEDAILSRYGNELRDRYNKRFYEDSMADYGPTKTGSLSPQIELSSENLREMDISDFIEALRPDKYVISYIALGVSNYKNVRAVYNPDGDAVSASDIAGTNWIYSDWEYDGYGYEYLCGVYRPGQLYSFCDSRYYTPPEKYERYSPLFFIVDGHLEETEEYSKVFAPFVQCCYGKMDDVGQEMD